MNVDMLAGRIEVCQYVLMAAESTVVDPGSDPLDGLCCDPLTTSVLGHDEAAELAAILKALADPVRLRLLSIIGSSPSGEVCACDLPTLLDRSQPTISHHLSQLVKAGFLDREQRGKWAWFKVRRDRLDAVRSTLCGPDRDC